MATTLLVIGRRLRRRALARLPLELTAELHSIYPRWVCYVSSPEPHRYFKGFKSQDALASWLTKHGYVITDFDLPPRTVPHKD